MESIGERIHKARLRKKVTLDEAHKQTKIHPKVLSALEEDRFTEVLSPTYIKGFLKSYCKYLELDTGKILEDYNALHKGSALPRPTLKIKEEEGRAMPRLSELDVKKYMGLAKQWAMPAAVIIFGILFGILIIMLGVRALSKIKNAGLFRPRQEITVKKEDTAFIMKPLSIPHTEPLSLIAKAKGGDVWLQVKADEKTLFQGVLKKGSIEAYKANDKFQLWTGKAEFLELSLNGNGLGSPGNGVMRKITLTREGLKIEKK